MIKTTAKNPGSFISAISAWEASAVAELEAVATGYIAEAFRYLVSNSAQGSGDFAANWNYSLNRPDYSFTRDAVDGGRVRDIVSFVLQDRVMGHPLAVNYAIDHAKAAQAQFKLGDRVYFTNVATHDEQYAWKIEDNKISFRAGNEGAPVQRTLIYMQQYNYINASTALKLKAERL